MTSHVVAIHVATVSPGYRPWWRRRRRRLLLLLLLLVLLDAVLSFVIVVVVVGTFSFALDGLWAGLGVRDFAGGSWQQTLSYSVETLVQYVSFDMTMFVTISKSAQVIRTSISLSSSSSLSSLLLLLFLMVMVAFEWRTLCVPLQIWHIAVAVFSGGCEAFSDDEDGQPQYSCTGTGMVWNQTSMVVLVPRHSFSSDSTAPIHRSNEPQEVVNNGGSNRLT